MALDEVGEDIIAGSGLITVEEQVDLETADRFEVDVTGGLRIGMAQQGLHQRPRVTEQQAVVAPLVRVSPIRRSKACSRVTSIRSANE